MKLFPIMVFMAANCYRDIYRFNGNTKHMVSLSGNILSIIPCMDLINIPLSSENSSVH